MNDIDQSVKQEVAESEKKGLYYYVNKRKAAGTSRPASSPKAPTAQAWKDAAKTAKKEGVDDNRTGFSRPPREMDEANLMYRYDTGDGKVKQRMIDNHDEKSAHREGFRDSIESALKAHGIIRSKFDPKKWVQKQGDKWLQVFPFGNSKDVSEGGAQQAAIASAKRESGKFTKDWKRIKESATVGATSSANIATVVNPNQAHSKKPVKSVNALDQDKVSLFGAPMETVKNTAGKKAAIIKRR